eukprot:Phypoly_transcript_13933.p1 GENE.Phypoly_transcript_13933~~Phypoly_transcript_13933.p1  ORF type:complete len:108 (+),score=10.06 Phypoly_transcript_13933:632-955(+)
MRLFWCKTTYSLYLSPSSSAPLNVQPTNATVLVQNNRFLGGGGTCIYVGAVIQAQVINNYIDSYFWGIQLRGNVTVTHNTLLNCSYIHSFTERKRRNAQKSEIRSKK